MKEVEFLIYEGSLALKKINELERRAFNGEPNLLQFWAEWKNIHKLALKELSEILGPDLADKKIKGDQN